MGAASKAGPPFRFLTPNLKLRKKNTAYCQMNLIHLNLMAGVSLDHPSKETPAKKSSGKMGKSPKFPVFLRTK